MVQSMETNNSNKIKKNIEKMNASNRRIVVRMAEYVNLDP